MSDLLDQRLELGDQVVERGDVLVALDPAAARARRRARPSRPRARRCGRRSACSSGCGARGGLARGEGGAQAVERLGELGFELGDLTHLCAFELVPPVLGSRFATMQSVRCGAERAPSRADADGSAGRAESRLDRARSGLRIRCPDLRRTRRGLRAAARQERPPPVNIPELRQRHPDHWMKAAALRVLAMDAVQKANSGHPGMPMGMADVATVLFERHLKFDAERAALAGPRPLRAVGRARVDAALRAAVPDRLRRR